MPDQRTPSAALSILNSYASLPHVYNLLGSSAAAMLARTQGRAVMVEHTEDAAYKAYTDIRFHLALAGRDPSLAAYLPSPDSDEDIGRRAITLASLYDARKNGADFILVTSEDAASEPAWLADGLKGRFIKLEAGDEAERDAFELELKGLGYSMVQLVTSPGQYSMRGYILDVFPTGGAYENPVRVEFFGDEIEGIRAFDIETQRSIEELDSVLVPPASSSDDPKSTAPDLYSALDGEELYISGSFKSDPPSGARVLSRFSISPEEGGVEAAISPFAGLGVLYSEREEVYALPDALRPLMERGSVMVIASSESQAERLREVFRDCSVVAPVIRLMEAGSYAGGICISVGKLSEGLMMEGLAILTEAEIFGGRPAYRSIRKSRVKGLLTSIDDLRQGDYIVHEDRGIGRFHGLVHKEVEGAGYDMLMLEYADGARLNLPLAAIEKIRKYQAPEGALPKLDSLGAKRWQKVRARVKQKVKDLADKLIKLYAEREVAEGHAFSPDTEMHREFDSFFPYEATPDQIKAIEEIKAEMEDRRPMDRLLCGDVGYGKTEVAMRAAFKAVFDHKQVAVLVPTTLLCEQHMRVFKKRFAAFPVRIEGLSRFRTKQEASEIADGVRKGSVDIVIATHALLRKDLHFADLGLLVIDEEHRFGVRQKEKIKQIGAGIDVLTMSATPIPRTLQMSLSGIRRMSVIETPPEERMAVRSTLGAFKEEVVKEAIEREMERSGQVFFVHNRISDIDRLGMKLKRLVPSARIEVAHGQMSERELESIMMRFIEGKVDVLLSTAIVGSGIDVPTANTIIVDMAHMMGLADLYQLKGRVGRSNIKAHAWFLVPSEETLTEEARMRLQAMQEMSYMGAGIRLAMRDLEIRGAGNLLGPEQSGAIEDVGFDMYMEMLESAVAELRGQPARKKIRPAINLRMNAFVPEQYIDDMALRLSIYRSISRASTEAALAEVEADVSDRFGKPPEEFMNLLKAKGLSIMAEALMIIEISIKADSLRFAYDSEAAPMAEQIMATLAPRKLKFYPDGFELRIKRSAYEEARAALEKLSSQNQPQTPKQ